ncbi:MAG: hypothetical protein KGM17_03540 [Sphingomonadales bacterium]|nr:hypothetical protein [Sphingomonadales bacterium]
MRKRMMIGAVALLAGGALAADVAPPFEFSPVPRWQVAPDAEPETGDVCAAIRAECKDIKDVTDIQRDYGYDLLYDADGMLVGVRTTHSTGCKPLDESMVLGERAFVMKFHTDGKPDLDDIRAELAPGTPRGAVRIVKSKSTQLSMGCNP